MRWCERLNAALVLAYTCACGPSGAGPPRGPSPDLVPPAADDTAIASDPPPPVVDRLNVIAFGAIADDVGDDTAAFQAAIDAATEGQEVYAPAGRYRLGQGADSLRISLGMSLVGDGAVLAGEGASGTMFEISNRRADQGYAPIDKLRVRGFVFDNVRLYFRGKRGARGARDIEITDCTFQNGYQLNVVGPRRKLKHWARPYASLIRVRDGRIERNTFLRSQGHGGRGVVIESSADVLIKDNRFGKIENGRVTQAHFRTAINVHGNDKRCDSMASDCVEYAEGISITDNVLLRGPSGEVSTEPASEDHGIYVRTFRDVRIRRNTIRGWSPTAHGGSVKIRQGTDALISENTMVGSGVLLNVYGNNHPHYLKRVQVVNNDIDMQGAKCRKGEAHRGILYYRKLSRPEATGLEESIEILDNRITDGGCVAVVNANAAGLCVAGNGLPTRVRNVEGKRFDGCRTSADGRRARAETPVQLETQGDPTGAAD